MESNNIINQYLNMCIHSRCLIRYLDVVMCLSHIHLDNPFYAPVCRASSEDPSNIGQTPKLQVILNKVISNILSWHV